MTASTSAGYCLFDTALGRAGLAWSRVGLCAVSLPESSDAHVRARLCARLGAGAGEAEPPATVAAWCARIAGLLRGARDELDDLVLDMTGVPVFAQRVYQVARTIPVGETITYGALARKLGAPGAARAVGRALGDNPFAPVVPCHRVCAASGGLGGFSAHGGAATKRRMLAVEAAHALPLFR